MVWPKLLSHKSHESHESVKGKVWKWKYESESVKVWKLESVSEKVRKCEIESVKEKDAFPDSSYLGIAEVGRVDSIPHVCENQVRLAEAAVHLTEKAHLIQISSQGKPSSGKQIF